MRIPYSKNYGSRVVMLGEDDGRADRIVSVANSFINAVGDTATAYFQAKNNQQSAQTPEDAAKWQAIAEIAKSQNGGNEPPKSDYMPWIIGGGVALGALVLLSGRSRRRGR